MPGSTITLVVIVAIAAALPMATVKCQISIITNEIEKVVSLFESVNDTSVSMASMMLQVEALLQRQGGLQNQTNIHLEKSADSEDKTASILEEIRVLLANSTASPDASPLFLPKIKMLLENSTSFAEKAASILPEILLILRAQATNQEANHKEISGQLENQLEVLQDNHGKARVTLNQIASNEAQALDLLAEINKTQTQNSNILAQTAATQIQALNALNQVVSLLKTQTEQQQNMTESIVSLFQKQQDNRTHETTDYPVPVETSTEADALTTTDNMESTTKKVNTTTGLSIRDCSDLVSYGHYPSGIYTISPNYSLSFSAYCDMDSRGGGWTVFQKRFNGSVDFYRDWESYAAGFGSLDGEFFWGLEKLHLLTTSPGTSWDLLIVLENFHDDTAYTSYRSFNISDAESGYRLDFEANYYCGTAGDSLTDHRGLPFSTYDRVGGEVSSYNCAVAMQGAWWYGDSCGYDDGSNLNGRYLGRYGYGPTGITWYESDWEGSLRASTMLIRPAKAPEILYREDEANPVANTVPTSIKHCSELSSYGSFPSGMYTISPTENLTVDAYCDMDTDGGGWLVFQKRFDGSVDFRRNWNNYTDGFGSLNGEFFWGLSNLHILTNMPDTSWQLMILLEDNYNDTAFANYHYFKIGDATTDYTITYDWRDFFCGNAGNSMYVWTHGERFSTFDEDNDDRSTENCAASYGAWWYSGSCGFTNLNGEYGSGMRWYFWKNSRESMKASTMMVKPMI